MNRLSLTWSCFCSIGTPTTWIPTSVEFDNDFGGNDSGIPDSSPKTHLTGVLNLIYTSFQRVTQSNFMSCVDAYVVTNSCRETILVSESDLFSIRNSLFNETLEEMTFVFDSVCHPETLSIVIRLLEQGRSVLVFLPWVYFGKEKRSPLSALVRHCKNKTVWITANELAMAFALIQERISRLHIRQYFKYI